MRAVILYLRVFNAAPDVVRLPRRDGRVHDQYRSARECGQLLFSPRRRCRTILLRFCKDNRFAIRNLQVRGTYDETAGLYGGA